MHEHDIQAALMQCLIDSDDTSALGVMNRSLQPRTAGNLAVYCSGYLERLVTVCCESILERPYFLAGDQLKFLLRDFFYSQPPGCTFVDEVLHGFDSFLDEIVDTTKMPPYLPDICRLAIRYWEIMKSEDPPTVAVEAFSPDRVSLAPACALVDSVWPLFDLWQHSDPDDLSGENQVVASCAQAVLGFKVSPYTFHLQQIDADIVPLAGRMLSGLSLLHAINDLSETEAQICPDRLLAFVASVKQANGFIVL